MPAYFDCNTNKVKSRTLTAMSTATAKSIYELNPQSLSAGHIAAAKLAAEAMPAQPWFDKVKDIANLDDPINLSIFCYKMVAAAVQIHNSPFKLAETDAQKASLVKFLMRATETKYAEIYALLAKQSKVEISPFDAEVVTAVCKRTLGR